MNNANMAFALGQMKAAKEPIRLDETYLVELNNGEIVTLGQLMKFWVEGHNRIQSALDIIKREKEEYEKENKTSQLKPANEKKAESKQRVERKKTEGKRKSKDRPCDS